MASWITLVCFFVLVLAKPRDDEDVCEKLQCTGVGYECINQQCYCADGYIPNHFQNRCYRCPGIGENCYGVCCNYFENTSLACWKGICQPCFDNQGNFICRESLDHIFLVSTTQIAMGTALVLGIIATFVLMYKLCAATNIRPLGTSSNYADRLSIGSLQVYIDERLRDAPPRYSRTAPSVSSASAVIPATVYLNSGFIHDCSIPPPPYSPVKEEDGQKEETNSPATLHI